jgi:hypothetical protein
MKFLQHTLLAGTMLAANSAAWAGQAPGALTSPDIPISHHDRVYSAASTNLKGIGDSLPS